VEFFLYVTFNSRFLNEICEKYSYIHHYINNYRFAINKYFVVGTLHSTFLGKEDPFCCTLFINAISDEIRSETINSTFDAKKHGAFIRLNAHFLSDATKV
jgi:hypothetical protein